MRFDIFLKGDSMNIEEMANYIVDIFPQYKEYYEQHLNDYGALLAHIFAIETINIPMENEFRENFDSAIFCKYCNLITYLWKNGNEEVRNVVDVTILEGISDKRQMWETFGRHISKEFQEYINTQVLTKNILMNHVPCLESKEFEGNAYTSKEIEIVKRGIDSICKVLFGSDIDAKRRLLNCLDWFMDPYYGHDISDFKTELKELLEKLVLSSKEDDVVEEAISLLEGYTYAPYNILQAHLGDVSERVKPKVLYLLNHEINEKIGYLFNRYWDEEISETEQYKLENDAEVLIREYGWSYVYDNIFEYLHRKCILPEEVINFAHLYWRYGWHKYSISNPYEFLGYLYYKIDMDVGKYDDMDILDSLAVSILPKSGCKDADIYINPRYLPETDPLLLDAVEMYKKGSK